MIKRLQQNSFFKAISLLASGSILGQIIGFLGSIIMTRLYAKEAIGAMTLVVAVTGMFGPVINGRFDYAIVKERDEDRANSLIALAIIIGCIFSVLVSIGSLFYFNTQEESLSPIIAAIFVLVILLTIGFTNVFRSYNNRIEDYKTMTWVIVIRKIAEEGSKAIFGLLHGGYIFLLVSRLLGEFFGMRQQTKHIRTKYSEIINQTRSRLLDVYKIHRKQLYFSTPAALMNSASYYILSLFIGDLFGVSELAVYSISVSVLGLPLSVISGNVSKVYFSEASKEYAETGNFKRSTKNTILILLALSIVVFAGMFWIIPILVPLVYGSGYLGAGEYIRILAPMFTIRFITSSVATGLVVANKQQQDLYLQGGFILAAVITFFISKTSEYSISTFLILISALYAIVYLLYLLFVVKASRGVTLKK